MKKLKYILLFVFAGLIVINACKKDDGYDFNKITPIIQSLNGTAAPMQGRHYEFVATIRGGSTFAWDAEYTAEIVPIPSAEGAFKTYVYFPDVITAGDVADTIYVTETTLGGVSSPEKKFTVKPVTPFAALPISGSTLVNAGFNTAYTLSPSTSDKLYSTFTWTATAGTITPSVTEPWKMSIIFANDEVGPVTITMTELTSKGMTASSTKSITVLEYCALTANSDLVGLWTGTDGFNSGTHLRVAAVETTAATATGVTIGGLNSSWIADKWGEEVTDGGTAVMKINADGTVTIADQYLFTTVYDGAPYIYNIVGEGRWNNCGTYPTLTITYRLINMTDEYTLPSEYYAFPSFTATLVMDGVVK